MTTQHIDALRTALAAFEPAAATNQAKILLAQAALQCAIELLD